MRARPTVLENPHRWLSFEYKSQKPMEDAHTLRTYTLQPTWAGVPAGPLYFQGAMESHSSHCESFANFICR